MEKLEIHHITPYLPYKLQVKSGNFILEMVASYEFIYEEFKNEFISIDYLCSTKGLEEVYKPILRPLSDLTKQIEYNGTKINPIDWIEKNTYPEKYEHCAIMNNGIVEMGYYKEYQKLFEWHFDVFGLIEKGLAIDINTLKNGSR